MQARSEAGALEAQDDGEEYNSLSLARSLALALGETPVYTSLSVDAPDNVLVEEGSAFMRSCVPKPCQFRRHFPVHQHTYLHKNPRWHTHTLQYNTSPRAPVLEDRSRQGLPKP